MGRRRNYPWNSRTEKQMTNLVSGLLAGLIVAPFAAVETIAKNGNDITYKKKDKKKDALFSLFLGIFFLTPLYSLFLYACFKYDLILFPIIGELLFMGLTILFFGFWWVIISELIDAFKKEKNSTNKSI